MSKTPPLQEATTPPVPQATASKPAKRRWLRRILLLGGFLILLPFLLYMTRGMTLHPLLTRAAIWATPRYSHYDLELAEIGGDWFGGLELKGLRVSTTHADAPLQRLNLGEIEIEYSLLALLRGNLDGLARVRADDLDLELDLSHPGRAEVAEESTGSGVLQLPAHLPELLLSRIRAKVLLPDGRTLELNDVALHSRATQGADDVLDLELGAIKLSQPAGDLTADVRAQLQYRGGQIELRELLLNGKPLLHDTHIDLRDIGIGDLAWDLHLALAGAELSAQGHLRSGQLRSDLLVQGLDVERLLAYARSLELLDAELRAQLEIPARGQLELSGDLRMSLDDPLGIDARLSLNAQALGYEARGIDKLSARLTLREGALYVAELELDAGLNHIEATGFRLPYDYEDVETLLAGLEGRLQADLRDLPLLIAGEEQEKDEEESSREPLPQKRPIPAHRLQLDLLIEGGMATVQTGRLETTGGAVDLRKGVFQLAAVDPAVGRLLRLDLDVQLSDLAPLGDVLATEPWSGSLNGAVLIDTRLPRMEGSAKLSGSGIMAAGYPVGEVEFDMRGDLERVQVHSATAISEAGQVSFSGAYDFETQELEGIELEALITRPEAYVEAIAPGARLQINASLSGDPMAPTGVIKVHAPRIDYGGTLLEDITLDAIAYAGKIDVTSLTATTPWGAVAASATMALPAKDKPIAIEVSRLQLSKDEHELHLQDALHVTLDGENISAHDLRLAGTAGSIAASFDQDATGMRVTAVIADLDPMPFIAKLLPAGVSVRGIGMELSLSKNGADLEVDAVGAIAAFIPAENEDAYRIAWDGRLAQGRAELKSLSVERGAQRYVDLVLSLPVDLTGEQMFAEGAVEITGRVELPAQERLTFATGEHVIGLEGLLTARLDLRGSWSELLGGVHIKAPSLIVAHSGADLSDYMPQPSTFECDLRLGQSLEIATLILTVPKRCQVNLHGRLGIGNDIPALVADAGASLMDASLQIEGDVELEELDWIGRSTTALKRLEGIVRLKLGVHGSLGDPRGDATLTLREGVVSLPGLPLLENMSLDMHWRDTTLELERLACELGASPLSLAGTIELDGEHPVIDLSINGENLLLQRSPTMRIRADTDLRIQGPMNELKVAGAVSLRNSRIAQEIDFLGALQGGGGGPSSSQRGLALFSIPESETFKISELDVRVLTAEPLQLLTNVARGAIRLDMSFKGTGLVPLLYGSVFLEDTKVKLPGGTFSFDSGMITFADPDPFVPTLELRGEARLAGYDVALQIKGPYDMPEVRLESNPPLESKDLVLLVTTGQVPTSNRSEEATKALTMYLAKDLLRKLVSDPGVDGEEGLIDRFDIITGRDVSKSGTLTTEVTFRMLDEWLVERDSVYLVAEQDVYEDINMGVRIVFRFN